MLPQKAVSGRDKRVTVKYAYRKAGCQSSSSAASNRVSFNVLLSTSMHTLPDELAYELAEHVQKFLIPEIRLLELCLLHTSVQQDNLCPLYIHAPPAHGACSGCPGKATASSRASHLTPSTPNHDGSCSPASGYPSPRRGECTAWERAQAEQAAKTMGLEQRCSTATDRHSGPAMQPAGP